jgi:hypothetical protein
MTPKAGSIAFARAGASASQEIVVAAPQPLSGLEALLRRTLGDGWLNLFRARAEVLAAIEAGEGELPVAPALDDALPPWAVPSAAAGRLDDRVLAEIDQDGYAFAREPIDAPFFDRRVHRTARKKNLVDIALVDGRVCVRKRFRGIRFGARVWGDRRVPLREWTYRNLWTAAGFYLYSEAAALLRLRDLPFVPKLRRIDMADNAIYVDYVQGETLRTQAARAGAVHDADVARSGLHGLSARELERREVELLESTGAGDFRREIAEMAREINARGVAPLDIKLGNFVRGSATGRLYWFDFEICRLSSQPRWEQDLALQNEILEHLLA